MFMMNFADDPKPGSPPPPPQPGKAGPQVEGNAPVEDEEEEEDIGGETAAVLTDIMPWAISILVHAALVILAVYIVWSLTVTPPEEEPLVPIAKLSDKPGALEVRQTKKLESQQAKRSVTRTQVQSPTNSPVEVKNFDIGVAGGAASSPSPFDGEVGDSPGFASFYGMGGNAKRIVYLIDASGSLMDTLPFVMKELNRSINDLVEEQEFTVIFFQDSADGRQFIEVPVPRPGMKRANGATKIAVADWTSMDAHNVVPRGRADPIEGIKKALTYRPELIFLLSDNITGRAQWEQDQGALVKAIDEANKPYQTSHGFRKAAINTIQFLYPDPLEGIKDPQSGKIMKPTLEIIADKSGGNYRFVSREELGLAR